MFGSLGRFMMGRYGVDTLNYALIAIALLVSVITRFFPIPLLQLLALVPLAACLFRIFSRNIARRAAENRAFLQFWLPVAGRLRGLVTRLRDREHRYFRCPQCGQAVRVPRGRGKLNITCPRCSHRFIRKT